ncbi:hypothetical protein OG828_46355 [Streptomyces sp. NBC_00457]|uniref:hypothetical protein n=1 Tax=unclassified Streptomyces TaxID=2593676 RepID=UPI002E202BC3|nr:MULTISPECIES: hypothetical protein [unclassified Streptomyces]
MATALTLLNGRLPKLSWLDIAERNSGAIRLTPTAAQPEPRNLRRIKDEVRRRWGVVQLIDMLKKAVLRTGCAAGTNTGIKSVASGGHGHTEDELRYVRYLSVESARAIAVNIRTPPSPPAAPSCGARAHRVALAPRRPRGC